MSIVVTGDMVLSSLSIAVPEVLLAISACALLLIGVLMKEGAFTLISRLGAAILLGLSALVVWDGLAIGPFYGFGGMMVRDGFANLLSALILGGSAIGIIVAKSDFQGRLSARFEYPVLVMFAALGMLLMVTSNDLLTLYIGLEMQSLALYVLAAFDRNTQKSPEAGMKYFILGAISSGFLLYGASLVYGYTGTTQFSLIGQALIAQEAVSIGLVVGLVFLLAGLAFKISAVPFHMWTPDVYQGAPMAVTALFAIVPKLAALGLIIRLVHGPFAPIWFDAQQILIFLSVASMVVGAIAALVQSNIKRLLAYSAIANIGYALLGVIAGGTDGIASSLVYMAIYTIMTIGIFACLIGIRKNGFAVQTMDDLSGLIKISPVMAYLLTLFLFSLSGIPPLAGFFGKLIVFEALVAQEMIWLAVLGVVASVIAAGYYLRLIKVMLFDDVIGDGPALTLRRTQRLVIALSVLFVVLFIVNPQWLITIATNAAGTLFG